MKTDIHLLSYLAHFFLEWEIFKKKKSCRENQNTILYSITFFSSENPAIYEIMWRRPVKPDRPQMTIERMCFACWITKATDRQTHTHRICYTYFFCPATMDMWTHLIITWNALYIACLSCYDFERRKAIQQRWRKRLWSQVTYCARVWSQPWRRVAPFNSVQHELHKRTASEQTCILSVVTLAGGMQLSQHSCLLIGLLFPNCRTRYKTERLKDAVQVLQ